MPATKDLADKRGNTVFFKPHNMRPSPGLNVRNFDRPERVKSVNEMKEDLAENGQLEPLKIHRMGEQIYIINGETRWRGTKPAQRQLNVLKSNDSAPLFPEEIAEGVFRAVQLGASHAEVAKWMNKSPSWVAQTLDFRAAPKEVHEAVARGEIAPTLAAKLVREQGPEAAVSTIREAVDHAKAAGKTKATAKHASKAAASGTYSCRVTGGGEMVVAIDGKAYRHSAKFFKGMAKTILKALEEAGPEFKPGPQFTNKATEAEAA
jgi:ParB-like chromosome segregation protein Spo0J